jgi:hypothetical protein
MLTRATLTHCSIARAHDDLQAGGRRARLRACQQHQRRERDLYFVEDVGRTTPSTRLPGGCG